MCNCKVIQEEVLRFPKGAPKNKRKRKNRKGTLDEQTNTSDSVGASTSQAAEEEVYHPVRCEQCNTEVGVYDKEEVYHFFNVLSSYT